MTFIGIDVQIRRGLPVCVLNEYGVASEARWLSADDAAIRLKRLLKEHQPKSCHVGIDAPRISLPSLRKWSFFRGQWIRSRGKRGRHCELVLNALGLARPQWTPLLEDAPDWMVLGFSLFEAVEDVGATAHEVFPAASYRLLQGLDGAEPVTMPLTSMAPGPRDVLDAVVAAYTVSRFVRGLGCAIGNGDGLGSIILPVRVERHPILDWPLDR